MELILHQDRVVATATDDYNGPDHFMLAPHDFQPAWMARYRWRNGQWDISVPDTVSMRQARLALLHAGHLQDVQSVLANWPDKPGEAARIEWEYATEVRRESSLVATLSEALDLTPEALDALFVLASEL